MSLKERKYYNDKTATNLRSAIENLSALIFPRICAGCESWTPMTGDILCLACATAINHAPTSHEMVESLIDSKGWTDQFFDRYSSLFIFENKLF